MASNSGKGAPANGSIYVCNLPEGTDETMLADYFGTIGLLKKDKRTGRPKIWLYRDKVTDEPKGDATVTYDDPFAALAAVEWFNNKDFHGSIIGVFMAESKSSYAVVEPSTLVGDGDGLEEDAMKDMNGVGGRGRGCGDASGKTWQQEGDWPCPNTRGGRAGGYKELDEEEIEETRRRRREAEDDGEMYDEFGNLKKKFRAKTQHAEAGHFLPGSGRAGWEVEELGAVDKDGRERSRDRGRERERDNRGSSKNRDREDRERQRSRSRDGDRRKDRSRDYDYDRDSDYGRDRERDRDKDRD